MAERFEQEENAKVPMLVKRLFVPKFTEAREEHLANADFEMLVTLAGIAIDVSLEQPSNAEEAMLVN